jgi:flagellar biosynthesis/type III secretory pathway chaperone
MNTKYQDIFSSLCQQEISLLEPFIEVLREERDALSLADIISADLISDRKKIIIEKLAHHAQQRNQQFVDMGLKNATSILAAIKTSVEMQQIWEKLTSLLIRARDLNEGNSRLLQGQVKYVENSVNYFKKHIMTEEYSDDGELAPNIQIQRDFGSA